VAVSSIRTIIQYDARFYRKTGLTVKEVMLDSTAFYQLATQGQLLLGRPGFSAHLLKGTNIQVVIWSKLSPWIRAYRFQESSVPLFLVPSNAS
jgi:hypothetical protein